MAGAALSFAGHTAFLSPARADGRATAYSIHMLAKIPSRCTLRDVNRIVLLTRDTLYGEVTIGHGHADFRLECNVPYSLRIDSRATRRVTRGYLIPTSLQAADDRPPPLAENERTSGGGDAPVHCLLLGDKSTSAPCEQSDGDRPTVILPRAVGRIDIARTGFTAAEGVGEPIREADIVGIEVGGRP